MAFEVYVSLEKEIVDKLPFLGEGYQYIHEDSSGTVYRGILYEMSKENYVKAQLRLLGQKEQEIIAGDKVFVMSGCAIPQFKIKDYLKSKGASLVSDITIATKFVGNEDTSEATVSGGQRSSALVFEMEYSRSLAYGVSPDKVTEWFPEMLETKSSESVNLKDVRHNKVLASSGVDLTIEANQSLDIHRQRMYFMTPLGAMILYQSILRSVPIINDGYVFEKLDKTIILDEDSYVSVDEMLGSEDKDNHKVGADILANCDIDKSLYWIWKLSRKYSYEVREFSQFKNIRLFIDKSCWGTLSTLNAESFIEYMHGKGLLTQQQFDNLVEEASKNYTNVMNSGLFDMVLVPSAKYKDYNDKRYVFPFTKEPDEENNTELVEEDYNDI